MTVNNSIVPAGPASKQVASMPEMIRNILRFVSINSLYNCSILNHQWREETRSKSQAKISSILFSIHDRDISLVYLLNTVTLQYSRSDCNTHSRPASYLFVLACQNVLPSIDTYDDENDDHHRDHAFPPTITQRDPTQSWGYQATHVVPNVQFKVGPSSGKATHSSFTNEDHQQSNIIPGYQQEYFTSSQPSHGRGSQPPRLDTSIDHHPQSDHRIPCPYPDCHHSDSSYSNEDNPPPEDRPMMSGSHDGGFRGRAGDKLAAIPEGSSDVKMEYMSHLGSRLHSQLQVGSSDHSEMDHSGPMESMQVSSYQSSTSMSQEAQPRSSSSSSSKSQKNSRKRSSSSKHSSSSRSDKNKKRERDWRMNIDTFVGRNSALAAMEDAVDEYVESNQGCSILERTRTSRIVWNDITGTETIWYITPMHVDTGLADPKRRFDPIGMDEEELEE